MNEFNLIQEYFDWEKPPPSVATAVGDDAAILNVPPNQQLVTSIDTLIAGVHFPTATPANAIGHKALAVNLSDLAAMGATPCWFTLALTLPDVDQYWLQGFSQGLKQLAQKHHCFLVGGDTTRGPLSISIQVMGVVDSGKALLRSGAKEGDKIYVTGSLGDAAAGLQSLLNGSNLEESDYCHQKLNYPTPRLPESAIIKHFASACIDVSDGMLQDLSHILSASKVGAMIDRATLPLSNHLKTLNNDLALNYALNGGDDYELLFTIPPQLEAPFIKKIESKACCIGIITADNNKIIDDEGNPLKRSGYNHFHE